MAKLRDVEYLVFESKGMVVCRLWGCREMALNRIKKYTYDGYISDTDRYLINDCYVGTSRCNPKDFKLEVMKEKALENAEMECDISINNAVRSFIYDLNHMLNEIELYGIHEVPEIKEDD